MSKTNENGNGNFLNLRIPVEKVLKEDHYIASWQYIKDIMETKFSRLSETAQIKYQYVYSYTLTFIDRLIDKCKDLEIECPKIPLEIIETCVNKIDLYIFFKYEIGIYMNFIAYDAKSFYYNKKDPNTDMRTIVTSIYDSKILDSFIDECNFASMHKSITIESIDLVDKEIRQLLQKGELPERIK